MKSCFFISPIGKDESIERKRSDLVLKHIITPVIKELGFDEPTRADLIGKAGSITNEIMTRITSDNLVITDLTGKNPNVFYELAIRHVSGLPIVHIMESGEDNTIPFDVYDVRTIFYDLKDLDSVDKVKQSLKKQIESFEKDPIVTPVSKFKALRTVYENNDPEKQALAKILNEISEKMNDLFNNEISSVRSEMGQILDELMRIQDLILTSGDFYSSRRMPSPFIEKRLALAENRGLLSLEKMGKKKTSTKTKKTSGKK